MKEKNFIIKFVIFVIILSLITLLAIYYTIEYLNKNEENQEQEVLSIISEVEKPVAEDEEYGIKSYTETYDANSLNINEYRDIDGKVMSEEQYDKYIEEKEKNDDDSEPKTEIRFIQIDGLLDSNIENKVNNRLKQESYNLNCDFVDETITANFANVLSLYINGYNEDSSEKTVALNIDLTTGDDIPLEKVFVSSAPLNSFLMEGLFEALGWAKAWEEEGGGVANMDKIDTSSYEDKALQLINKFKKEKENIEYSIYPNQLIIWNIVDKSMLNSEYDDNLTINFIKHKESVAIYKRYLTEKSIYKQDSIGTKNIIILTEDMSQYGGVASISYGKIADNIFMEEIWFNDITEEQEKQAVQKYIEKLSQEQKNQLLKKDFTNKGVFFQREFQTWEDEDAGYYCITALSYQATCDIEYFKEEAFGDYIKAKTRPRADATINGFEEYLKDDYPNLKISETKQKDYYISKTGEFLGNTEKQAKKKIKEKKQQENKKTTIQNQTIQNQTTQNQTIQNQTSQNNTTNETEE